MQLENRCVGRGFGDCKAAAVLLALVAPAQVLGGESPSWQSWSPR
jgi:hypothetical protein